MDAEKPVGNARERLMKSFFLFPDSAHSPGRLRQVRMDLGPKPSAPCGRNSSEKWLGKNRLLLGNQACVMKLHEMSSICYYEKKPSASRECKEVLYGAENK